MKTALLFPGQGVQYSGMGKELYAHYDVTKAIYDQASNVLEWDVKEVCFEDQQKRINQTRYTQGALFTTNLGIYEALKAEGVKPDAVLGFSLGEYDALVTSGILSFEEALSLVDYRALYMDECAESQHGGMRAIIGLEAEKVYRLCKEVSEKTGLPVTVANDNCDGQITVAGTKEALEGAEVYFKAAGAKRIVPLQVSGAFHSPLMLEASLKLTSHLEDIHFSKPIVPIVSNVSAQFMNEEEARKNIPLQIVQGVRFRESVNYLLNQGFDTFIEVGPKTVLSNLVRKIAQSNQNSFVDILQVENCEGMGKVIRKFGG